jgi:hypothetical protein
MKIEGHVSVTLRDSTGSVLQHVEGPNTTVEMSNNILMDSLYPVILDGQTWDSRTPSTNMTGNTTFPTGAYFIGATGDSGTESFSSLNRNKIGFIAIGNNINSGLGANTLGPTNSPANQNSDDNYPYSHNQLVYMVDEDFDITSSNYCKSVQVVEFLASNSKVMRFSTTFDTTEGNISNGVAEVGLWTIGENTDANGHLVSGAPASTSAMRLFAHKVLPETIIKTTNGSIDITYTLTFSS